LIFADGSSWGVDTLHAKGLELHGTDSNDTLQGLNNQSDRLHGHGGDDRLYGQNGNDQLYGGEGNDLLDGGTGADLLDGGDGNDTLTTHYNSGGTRFRGGLGNDVMTGSYRDDTYHYRLGDGRDVIQERYHYSGQDRLQFEGVDHDRLWFERSGNDLHIDVLGDEGRVTVDDWFRGSVYQLEVVQAADGMSLTNTAIDQLVAAMAAFSKPDDAAESLLSHPMMEELQPVLASSWSSA
jgi:Ca2+-binding RTX toxin-like protein